MCGIVIFGAYVVLCVSKTMSTCVIQCLYVITVRSVM